MGLPEKILQKITRRASHGWNELRHITGKNENLYKNARGAAIVTYHGICLRHHTKFNSIFTLLNTFKKHLAFYKRYFNVISLDAYYAGCFDKDRFNICISFDDGYHNNYKYVLPLLNELSIPATFFITGIREAGYDILWNDFLGILSKFGPDKINFNGREYYKNGQSKYVSVSDKEKLVNILSAGGFEIKAQMMQELASLVSFRKNKQEEDFWLQMTEEQIKLLSVNEFCSIGAHGYYHNDLAAISLSDAKNDMKQSKEFLESIIKKPVEALAFPYGSYSAKVIGEAKNAGFKQLLALDFISVDDARDQTMRERMIVNPYISVANQMHALIKGSYE